MPYKPGTMKVQTIGLTNQQYSKLKKLSERTRVPMQQYLRESVDDLLKKYRREIKP